jgi:hypothetical protein
VQHTTQKKHHALGALDIKNIMEQKLGATHNKKKCYTFGTLDTKNKEKRGRCNM